MCIKFDYPSLICTVSILFCAYRIAYVSMTFDLEKLLGTCVPYLMILAIFRLTHRC